MGSREYGQSCSLACALDRVGERWTLLIVRELSLGPLRFSALARSIGGAPTDVVTKRLRDLERHGILARRELDPPASTTVYELTELGRGLERPMLELGRWGMGLQRLEDVVGLAPTCLPTALRVLLCPPEGFAAAVGLRSEGQSFELRFERDGWIGASRGTSAESDLVLSGAPLEVIAALLSSEAEGLVEVEGNRDLVEELRSMLALPDRLREEALEALPTLTAA